MSTLYRPTLDKIIAIEVKFYYRERKPSSFTQSSIRDVIDTLETLRDNGLANFTFKPNASRNYDPTFRLDDNNDTLNPTK